MNIEMDDKVPTVCSTKILLVISIIVVLGGFSCGGCVVYYCLPCAVTKQVSDGDLTSTSNVTCFQSQIPSQTLSMCNVTFSSNVQHTILQEVFDFLWTIEDINKSLPPFSESGIIMLRKDLLQVIQQLEYDVQSAVKHVKKLQESLKPKYRRRPPPHFKT